MRINEPVKETFLPVNQDSQIRVRIEYDQDCHESPREWDNLWHLLLHPSKSHWLAENEHDGVVHADVEQGANAWEHAYNVVEQQLGLRLRDVIVYPITKFEHGNVALYLGDQTGMCQFDAGIVGFAYATRAEIRKWFNAKRCTQKVLERAKDCLKDDLSTLQAWINGEVYGYELELVSMQPDIHGNYAVLEELDSCWGYIGDAEYCESEAMQAAEYNAKRIKYDTTPPEELPYETKVVNGVELKILNL